MTINPYSIVPGIVGPMMFILGVVTFLKNRSTPLHKSFSLVCIFLVFWPTSLLFTLNMQDSETIVRIAKIGHLTCTFGPAMFFDFIIKLLNKKNRWLIGLRNIALIYAVVTIPVVLGTSLYFNEQVKMYSWGLYTVPGPLLHLDFALGMVVFVVGYALLFSSWPEQRRILSPQEYNRFRYIAAAVFVFPLAMVDYLPKYGVPIPPIGSYFLLAFFIIVSCAIYKHQILDISIVIRKTVIYSTLVALVTAIYFSLVFTVERIFQGAVGYDSLAISLAVGFVVALGFIPLRNFVQSAIDRIFFKKTQIALAEENDRLREELVHSEKMKAIATLSAGLAHEIKNPLTSIKTFTESVRLKGSDPVFQEKFERIVGGEVERIQHTVQRLLEFAKPQPPNFEKTDINNLVDETVDLLNNQLVERHVHLDRDYCDSSIIEVDSKQLKQVFLNLFLNSLDAVHEQAKISIETKRMAQGLRIVFSDNGCGIKHKHLDHIFDPFYSTKKTGNGLGLAVVESIIKQHGGTIDISSKEGKGTQVSIELGASPVKPNNEIEIINVGGEYDRN